MVGGRDRRLGGPVAATGLSPPEPARRAGWNSWAVKLAGWVPSPVACVVSTRPGD